ncbi:MAG: PDZ domain-containing protein [Planctomycetia bacterium]|nr:PDZ domain-containing protein [Planctomycetia bacterium]
MLERILTLNCKYTLGLAIAAALVSGQTLFGQETKQLKEPAVPQVAAETEDATEVATEETDTADESLLTPGARTSRSYSIVVENRLGPDGKRIQTKKVWKDGQLVENTENTIEPGTGQEELDESPLLTEDAMDGEMSDELTDLPTPLAGGNPFEAMRALEQQMLQRQRAQFEQLQQLWSQQGMRGPFRMYNSAGTDMQSRAPQKLSDYWIGASVQGVPMQVASYLGLEPGTGVMVVDVLPDSPAAKAGLQPRDILLTLGETPITDAWQIGTILDESQGGVQKVTFLRQGREETAELTPEKRPEQPEMSLTESENTDAGDEAIRVVRPGIIIPGLNGETGQSASEGGAASSSAAAPSEEAKPSEQEKPATPAVPDERE